MKVSVRMLLCPNQRCHKKSDALEKCGVRGIGQVAKLPAARVGSALDPCFRIGEVRQRLCREECGLEVTMREQQRRRMKHEKREGEMERHDTRTANTLSHACMRCLYTNARKKCQKNVRATRSVCTLPVAHTAVATTWVRNPETKKKSSDFEVPLPS